MRGCCAVDLGFCVSFLIPRLANKYREKPLKVRRSSVVNTSLKHPPERTIGGRLSLPASWCQRGPGHEFLLIECAPHPPGLKARAINFKSVNRRSASLRRALGIR